MKLPTGPTRSGRGPRRHRPTRIPGDAHGKGPCQYAKGPARLSEDQGLDRNRCEEATEQALQPHPREQVRRHPPAGTASKPYRSFWAQAAGTPEEPLNRHRAERAPDATGRGRRGWRSPGVTVTVGRTHLVMVPSMSEMITLSSQFHR